VWQSASNQDYDKRCLQVVVASMLGLFVLQSDANSEYLGDKLTLSEYVGEKVTLKELNARYKLTGMMKGGESVSFTDIPKTCLVGTGSYGLVAKATDPSGRQFAIKVVRKSSMTLDSFRVEAKALRKSRMHPYITQLVEVLDCDETNSWYLVTEFCEGGELFDRLIDSGPFTEDIGRQLVENIVQALQHIHSKGIAHMDIKPENLLFKAHTEELLPDDVKLIDFGMAVDLKRDKFQRGTKLIGKMGTTAYWAPELAKLYSNPDTDSKERLLVSDPRACDMFSLGLVAYIVLFGCHPFDPDGTASESLILERAVGGSYSFEVHNGLEISSEARTFISNLLERDPSKRMRAKEALHHSWLRRKSHYEKMHYIASSILIASLLKQVDDADLDSASFAKLAFDVMTSGIVSVDISPVITGTIPPVVDEHNAVPAYLDAFNRRVGSLTLSYKKGSTVFEEGDVSDGMYIVVNGAVQLEYTGEDDMPRVVGVLGPGDIFGETALFDGRSTRNATVRCKDNVQVIRWSSEQLLQLLDNTEALRVTLEKRIRWRQQARAGDLIESLSVSKPRRLSSGEVLFSEGEEADALFLVDSGELESFLGDMPVRRFKKGDILGADSVTVGRRILGMRSVGSAKVLVVQRENLLTLLEKEPSLYQNLLRFSRRDTESKLEILDNPQCFRVQGQPNIAVPSSSTLHLEQGDVLHKRGDPADSIFHVDSGYVTLYAYSEDNPNRDVVVRRLGPGSNFGQNALLDNAKWEFTAAVSSKNATIVKFPVASFKYRGLACIGELISSLSAGK